MSLADRKDSKNKRPSKEKSVKFKIDNKIIEKEKIATGMVK
jgi:hypothetical protein